MSMSIAGALSSSQRRTLSPRAMTIFGIVAAVIFSASGAAPTPVYRLYQESLGLTPFWLTSIFAVYAFSLLAALLTVGSLSDYVGRRPVIFAALIVNAIAMVLFIEAHSAGLLILARAVQGFASGAATTALGAAILDTARRRGPLFNSLTAFAGLTLGSLGSGALVAFAPLPTQLVYIVLLVASVVLALTVLPMPETALGKSGAFASLRPDVRVPPQALRTLIRITPVNIAAWALGGFYFSLMPSLVRAATGLGSPFVGGAVIATMTMTAAVAVFLLRERRAALLLTIGTTGLVSGIAITLAGVFFQLAGLMMMGALVAGLGFGSAFSGTFRTLLPLAAAGERAGLLAAYYVQSYLAFAVPAILIGLAAPALGLTHATYLYGAVLIALAAVSFFLRHELAEANTKP
ncbi:MFS transporter [Kaistia dalseonensis]|uniref:Major facilitator superfamily (MFS) profile domain-containing protein n=1 Tax=Kaistia dalseonensis TaxID=410840 RepID=A0ABU0HD66_9HYPH|nr:MFS transporter [Kaistia dalseonensis]MCX5497629.1 MFS transporter [Kaistia dalseonensis]MDQ0440271.1 hypothetical protein [Kaistia dalseonensis]